MTVYIKEFEKLVEKNLEFANNIVNNMFGGKT